MTTTFAGLGMKNLYRENRELIIRVAMKDENRGVSPFYIFSEEQPDLPHDLGQYFHFIDTGELACGRKVELTDEMAGLRNTDELPAGVEPLQVCEDCLAAIDAWSQLPPDERLIRQILSSIEGTVVARQEAMEHDKRTAEMILELDDLLTVHDDTPEAREILSMITEGKSMRRASDESIDAFDKIMTKSVKKFSNWGYEDYPPQLLEAGLRQRDQMREIDREHDACTDVLREFVRPYAELLRAHEEEQRPSRPAPQPISREERLARRREEREERERRAAENTPFVAHKPVKRNRKLEQAIAAVDAAEKEERSVALRVLRQVALEAGDDQWASYARRELKGTREGSP